MSNALPRWTRAPSSIPQTDGFKQRVTTRPFIFFEKQIQNKTLSAGCTFGTVQDLSCRARRHDFSSRDQLFPPVQLRDLEKVPTLEAAALCIKAVYFRFHCSSCKIKTKNDPLLAAGNMTGICGNSVRSQPRELSRKQVSAGDRNAVIPKFLASRSKRTPGRARHHDIDSTGDLIITLRGWLVFINDRLSVPGAAGAPTHCSFRVMASRWMNEWMRAGRWCHAVVYQSWSEAHSGDSGVSNTGGWTSFIQHQQVPVIVAEIGAQRVDIQDQSHGAAQQFCEHFSVSHTRGGWGGSNEKKNL